MRYGSNFTNNYEESPFRGQFPSYISPIYDVGNDNGISGVDWALGNTMA
jgi:hypothetical protein